MKISTTRNRHHQEFIYTTLSIAILLLIWQFVSMWIGKEIIIPSPAITLSNLLGIIIKEDFLLSVTYTLARTISGFLMAFSLALILGMSAGFFNPIYYLLKPIIVVTKAVPTMGIILLALIWLESEKAPILVGFLIIFPILYGNIVQGIREVDVKLIEMVKLYQVSKLSIIKEVYIPSIKSYLIAGASTAIGLNLKTIIAAEVLSQPKISMGINFQIEKANLNTAGVFAWSIIAIILAGVLDEIVKRVQKSKAKERFSKSHQI